MHNKTLAEGYGKYAIRILGVMRIKGRYVCFLIHGVIFLYKKNEADNVNL